MIQWAFYLVEPFGGNMGVNLSVFAEIMPH